jgi:hypothetical protein
MDVHDVAVEGLNIGAKTTSFGGPFTHMYAALIYHAWPLPSRELSGVYAAGD